jgi:hypothetical protein
MIIFFISGAVDYSNFTKIVKKISPLTSSGRNEMKKEGEMIIPYLLLSL